MKDYDLLCLLLESYTEYLWFKDSEKETEFFKGSLKGSYVTVEDIARYHSGLEESLIDKIIELNKQDLSILSWVFYDDDEEYDNEYIKKCYDECIDKIKLNPKMVKDVLQLLPYTMYLKTKYWKLLSMYKKMISDNRCQLCNKKTRLETHHNNYKNRGYEYNNLNDLIVLCHECHSKHHNK